MYPRLPVVLALVVLAGGRVHAAQVDALAIAQDWTVRRVAVRGNDEVSARSIAAVMVTQDRPWYTPWRPRPPFDPVTFRTDVERVRTLYRSRGYYRARVEYDIELPAEGTAVDVVLYVDEGPRVMVARVDVEFVDARLPEEDERTLLARLPVEVGAPFTQDAYERAQSALRTSFRQQSYARVSVTRHATVDVEQGTADVAYTVRSGAPCVFGPITIAGTRLVDPPVVERELAFRPGDQFRESRLTESRSNLLELSLFQTIRFEEGDGTGEVPITVRVTELPPRAIQFGAGYDTFEGFRGLAGWRHYNFLGGARQLGFTASVSTIERSILADFLQPHWPVHATRARLLFAQQQEDEDTYNLLRTRGSPRLEWQVTPRISTYAAYRAEYDRLRDVPGAVRRALPDAAPRDSVLSGMGFGTDWNATDDLLNPGRGFVLAASVEPVGAIFGGDIDFVRVIGQGRVYQPLGAGFLGAARLRLGTAEPIASSRDIPLFERFYAGGINSVRGYGRRRVGPLVDDDPIGGRSLVETSVELRHPITTVLDGAVFVDAGQVSLETLDFPWDDLEYGSGVAVRYRSPVGPVGLELGFPFDPPPGDRHWQVYLSVGQVF